MKSEAEFADGIDGSECPRHKNKVVFSIEAGEAY
jgi:hypothetical protein